MVRIDEAFEFFQERNAVFDSGFAARFNFDQTVRTVSQVNNGIAFETVFVTIMINGAVKSIRKNPQIADAKRFKLANTFGSFLLIHLAKF